MVESGHGVRLQNQGYAAGRAAAMAARAGRTPRAIDVRALQEHLVKIGNLPESVLGEKDSFPVSDERLAEAVRTAGDGYQGVQVILTAPERRRSPTRTSSPCWGILPASPIS